MKGDEAGWLGWKWQWVSRHKLQTAFQRHLIPLINFEGVLPNRVPDSLERALLKESNNKQ